MMKHRFTYGIVEKREEYSIVLKKKKPFLLGSDIVPKVTQRIHGVCLVAAGFSFKGKLMLRKIKRSAKINSEYYQQNILTPIFRHDIPSLYGNECGKVVFHHDKATSHVSRSTVNFFDNLSRETGINTIPVDRIPVKSPDLAPMDFCVFGCLKMALGKRHPTSLDGLWKVVRYEWNKLDMTVLRRSLLSWKIRCRAVAKRGGHQIEHLKSCNYGL